MMAIHTFSTYRFYEILAILAHLSLFICRFWLLKILDETETIKRQCDGGGIVG